MRCRAFAVVLVSLVLTVGASAGPIPIVVLGDSISDPYSNYTGANNPATGLPFWGSAGDKNWVEQFQGHFGGNVSIFNNSLASATTSSLLGSLSDQAVLNVQQSSINHGVVIAGSNDVLAFLNGQLGSDPAAFVSGVASNLNSLLNKVSAAGPVQWVVGNIPDLSLTPAMQTQLGGTPGALQNLQSLVQSTNQQIAAVAAAHGAVVVDLYDLSHVFDNPVVLAGTTVPSDKAFAPDGLNFGSIPQALVSNTIMTAFGGDLGGLQLSDQAILKQVGLSPTDPTNPTFFDVSPFILVPPIGSQSTPEPASFVLLGLAGCLVGARRFRRRAVIA